MSNGIATKLALASYQIIDFHSHFVAPTFPVHTLAGVPAAQRSFWESKNRLLSDPEAPNASLEESGVAVRVISTPLEFVREPGSHMPLDMVRRVNDSIAELVTAHPGRLHGLATVDAYNGEPAAKELTRAVEELGLRGVFVESAKGGLLPDCAPAQPTFAAASALGVPVFLHPVPDAPLKCRFKGCGRFAERLVRSTVNSAALLAMLESEMFEKHRNLSVVVTALAFGGLAIAAGPSNQSLLPSGAIEVMRKHVFIDTNVFHPVLLRASVDLLGADNVIAGSDWPVNEGPMGRVLTGVMQHAGLTDEEQSAIAEGNCRRLLGMS